MTWKNIVGTGVTADRIYDYVKGLNLPAHWAKGEFHPEFVVLHNTSAPSLAQWKPGSGKQRMGNLVSYYRDTMKWSAGPHMFVAPELIWLFTPLTVSGVHSPSWNDVAWGIEMVGDYETESFTSGRGLDVQHNALAAVAALHAVAGFDSTSLRFHKEDPATTHKTCPGKHAVKADFIANLHNEIAALKTGR